jgi:hypothetical protein
MIWCLVFGVWCFGVRVTRYALQSLQVFKINSKPVSKADIRFEGPAKQKRDFTS